MNTAGFAPADHALWKQIEGAGELSERIMQSVGTYGIDAQDVQRKIILAIAELERKVAG